MISINLFANNREEQNISREESEICKNEYLGFCLSNDSYVDGEDVDIDYLSEREMIDQLSSETERISRSNIDYLGGIDITNDVDVLGSSYFTRYTDYERFGDKLKNRDGYFYYSIGEFNLTYELIDGIIRDGIKMFVAKPEDDNPIGLQYSENGRAKVYIEDVKGVILMNLDQVEGNSDDWNLEKVEISFDENIYSNTMNNYWSNELYQEFFNNSNIALGDNSGDSKGFMIVLNTSHNESDSFFHSGGVSESNYYTERIYELIEKANICILDDDNDVIDCIGELENYLGGVEEGENYIFCRWVDDPNYDILNLDVLGRINPIIIDFCNGGI